MLEFLYKGDYLLCRHTRELEDGGKTRGTIETAVHHQILIDTIIYCTAETFGLEELKQLALQKHDHHSGIDCDTVLASAQYDYANTSDTDSKLRAHFAESSSAHLYWRQLSPSVFPLVFWSISLVCIVCSKEMEKTGAHELLDCSDFKILYFREEIHFSKIFKRLISLRTSTYYIHYVCHLPDPSALEIGTRLSS